MNEMRKCEIAVIRGNKLTEIQGCFSASAAVILFAGLMVSILLMRSLASGVTVSHSGEGNYAENTDKITQTSQPGGRAHPSKTVKEKALFINLQSFLSLVKEKQVTVKL